jgi:hypothetical protein
MVERSLAVLGLAIRTLGSVPARPQAFVAFGLPAMHTGHYIHSVANAKNAKKPGGIVRIDDDAPRNQAGFGSKHERT